MHYKCRLNNSPAFSVKPAGSSGDNRVYHPPEVSPLHHGPQRFPNSADHPGPLCSDQISGQGGEPRYDALRTLYCTGSPGYKSSCSLPRGALSDPRHLGVVVLLWRDPQWTHKLSSKSPSLQRGNMWVGGLEALPMVTAALSCPGLSPPPRLILKWATLTVSHYQRGLDLLPFCFCLFRLLY